ncbi:MAG: leucyl aminopeptidase [candidate division NC10 bacterium]|nr:leucyl aminopeptidase [candidate division NC10 bacterium]
MEIRVERRDILTYEGDALVVNLFEGVEKPGGATGAVDRALDGAIQKAIANGELRGKLHEKLLLHTFGKLPTRLVLVIGLGKQEQFTLDRGRSVSAEALKTLKKAGTKKVGTIVHGAGIGGLDLKRSVQAIAEGVLLGLYAFTKYKKEENHKEIQEVVILERETGRIKALEEGVGTGRILAQATNLARDLVNEPANVMTPIVMAERAREVADSLGLECQILGPEEIRGLGMGAFWGVAQGSQQPPRLIVLRYKGGKEDGPHLGFVGKGITFDSGGISIKPSEGMEAMKGDMAGGAAVIAAIKAVAELGVPVNVTAIIPATENLPSGTAQRPGDVVRAMNGKTIEVINTDAEGRLILADALCYARSLGVSRIVDVATLTGACVVALGSIRTGAFGNDQGFIDQVVKAGEEAGEKIWPMPMDEEYNEQIKSDVADLKNVGGRKGGAITAARFLANFVEDTPWVHLDIAGTSMAESDKGYTPKGATGVGVRTLVNLAVAFAKGEWKGKG